VNKERHNRRLTKSGFGTKADILISVCNVR
jgi:hypothetical protein